MAASANCDGLVKIWAVDTLSEKPSPQAVGRCLLAIQFMQGDKFLAFAGAGGEVGRWSMLSGQMFTPLAGAHGNYVCDLASSADGRIFASGGDDEDGNHVVSVWDNAWEADAGKPVAVCRGHSAHISDLSVSADGKLLLSASLDGTVRRWNAKSGVQLDSVDEEAMVVEFLPGGEAFVSGGSDGNVRLWTLEEVSGE